MRPPVTTMRGGKKWHYVNVWCTHHCDDDGGDSKARKRLHAISYTAHLFSFTEKSPRHITSPHLWRCSGGGGQSSLHNNLNHPRLPPHVVQLPFLCISTILIDLREAYFLRHYGYNEELVSVPSCCLTYRHGLCKNVEKFTHCCRSKLIWKKNFSLFVQEYLHKIYWWHSSSPLHSSSVTHAVVVLAFAA